RKEFTTTRREKSTPGRGVLGRRYVLSSLHREIARLVLADHVSATIARAQRGCRGRGGFRALGQLKPQLGRSALLVGYRVAGIDGKVLSVQHVFHGGVGFIRDSENDLLRFRPA